MGPKSFLSGGLLLSLIECRLIRHVSSHDPGNIRLTRLAWRYRDKDIGMYYPREHHKRSAVQYYQLDVFRSIQCQLQSPAAVLKVAVLPLPILCLFVFHSLVALRWGTQRPAFGRSQSGIIQPPIIDKLCRATALKSNKTRYRVICTSQSLCPEFPGWRASHKGED